MLFLFFGVGFLVLGAGEGSYEDSLSKMIVMVFQTVFLFLFVAFSFGGELASASSDTCRVVLKLGCTEGVATISCTGGTIFRGVASMMGIEKLSLVTQAFLAAGVADFSAGDAILTIWTN